MKKSSFMAACAALVSCTCLQAEDPVQDYQLDWSEFEDYDRQPEWFQDAKLGIYFHWGIYSVPAFGNEWYPRNMHFEGKNEYTHHIETYGPLEEFGYHDFVPMFKAEHFDAAEWADLFKQAGARFAGPVAEHHDGFAMWDSEITPWNVADKGPKRDITGELEKEIRGEGMKFIATFHHARNLQRPEKDPERKYPHRWYQRDSHYPSVEGFATVSDDPELKYLYGNMEESQWLEEVWLGKLKEVIDKYSPDIIWFDSWLHEIPEAYRLRYLQYYNNEAAKKGQQVVTTFKQHDLPDNVAVFNIEKGGKTEISEDVWQSDDTISLGSWCYTEDLKIKPASMVVHGLIDIVSKNGVLLLNISPKADGTIPQDQRDVLLRMGKWLERNGEAIYATRPWLVHGEGPTGWEKGTHGGMKTTNIYSSEDKRYTRSKDRSVVFAHVLGEPEAGGEILLSSFSKDGAGAEVAVSEISIIGSDETVKWSRSDDGIHIEAPIDSHSDIAIVYRLKVGE